MDVKGFHSIVYRGENNGRIDVPESWIGEEVIVQLLPKKTCQKCGKPVSTIIWEELHGVCENCSADLKKEYSEYV